jgi:hypothetical protein
MKKLTHFEVENLIENLVVDSTKKSKKISPLGETFIKKWRTCKTKKDKFMFFEQVMDKKRSLLSEGLDSKSSMIDEGLFDLFKSVGVGGWSTFKEWMFQKLLTKIASMFGSQGDPDLIKGLSIGLSNIDWTDNWRKLLSPVQNCEFFANAMVDGVIEYYVDKKIDTMFGDTVFGDTLRNAVVDALNDEKHVQSIQNILINIVCKATRSLFGGKGIFDAAKTAFSGGKPSMS